MPFNNQLFKIGVIFYIVFVISCEDKSSSEAVTDVTTVTTTNVNDADVFYDLKLNNPINIKIDSITTTNINVSNIYFALEVGDQVDITAEWDLSIIKDVNNYNMPSFVPGDVDIAVYEDIDFSSINELPDSFADDIQNDHSVFGYEGIYEVLSYDITVHKVSVSNPDYVYLVRSDNSVYKLQFIEYLSGITVFQYSDI